MAFLCTVFKQRVDQGAAVIVGRAAYFLLKDRKNIVSLFLYASEIMVIRRIFLNPIWFLII